MDKKPLAVLLAIIACSSLAMGCSGKKSEATPAQATGTVADGLEPSLADMLGEGLDEGGLPESGLPTPTLG
jgi:hypothetical protein